MTFDRRQFCQTLAAGLVLAPFVQLTLPRRALAASRAAAAPKRLIVLSSLGTNKTLWTPSSAPGAPLVLQQGLSPLAPYANDILLVDGLSFANPTEGHSTPQTLTGYTFANGYGPTCTSVDQYIASKVGTQQRLASLLLGWQAGSEAQFWQGGRRLSTLDNPSDAWQTAFAGVNPQASSATGASGTAPDRASIWRLVSAQLKDLRTSLSGDNRDRLDDHLNSMNSLLKLSSAPAGSATCAAPPQPSIAGAAAMADVNQASVADAHIGLLVAALACDVTRVAGMQFGVSNRQYMAGTVNNDEHSAIHSGESFYPVVIGAEQATAAWFAKLIATLKSTADPFAPGSTLLDNTMVMWTRDMGHGPAHTQYSMPYVLAGGTGYLKKQSGGSFIHLGGDDASSAVGQPHQRLLLNLIEYMGAGNGADFGTVSALAAGTRIPLTEIKA